MKDKEFILECFKRLIPNTRWYGETYHDDESIENLDVLGDALYLMLDELLINIAVARGYANNYSANAISEKKIKLAKKILESSKKIKEISEGVIIALQDALEEDKEIPMKITTSWYGYEEDGVTQYQYCRCPDCNSSLTYSPEKCPFCKRKLDWSEFEGWDDDAED